MTISLKDQIAAVSREISLRERNYPKWVSAGKMRERDANYQLNAMIDVRDSLTKLRELTGDPGFQTKFEV